MNDVRQYTRRAPTTPIDPDLVKPGTKWPKNRAEHQGKPPIYDIVDSLEEVDDIGGKGTRVHYHNSDTGRRGSMMLRDFVKGSEHRLPDPEPAAEERPDDAPATVADIKALHAKLDEILVRVGPRQLRLVGS